jgi:tetratricopeptide (TPR) repeat protein
MELTEAHFLYAAGGHDEAELVLRDCTTCHGMTARAANTMGLISSDRRKLADALEWFKQASDLDPRDAICLGNYGHLLADVGNDVEGEAVMRSALALAPRLQYLYTRLGRLYRSRGDEQAALKEFREAIRLAEQETGRNPESGPAWREAERLYRFVGDYELAAEAERRAAAIEQDARFEGDHTAIIASSDSGFLQGDDRT